MSDLNNNLHKGSPLLYLREDKLKETLNNFFLVYKTFENQILDNASVNGFGIADIRCILIILLYPGITFNELLIKLSITKQSLNRVLKILLEKKMVIQETNKKDKRMKNLYLSDESKKIINNLIGPTIKEISNAFQKSGSEAVNGFNQIFLNLAEKNK
ncbi:MAG: MarR family winged helix-turn-helix transcriptional regulator [Candidatus Pelagibacterales bacterium]|jgi:DNA-binding MarR family transcriptional regulator